MIRACAAATAVALAYVGSATAQTFTPESVISPNGVTVLPPDGSVVTKGNISATHLQFLVDDSLKQNVTFADKKKMLFNILGLKVVDYATTPDFSEFYAGDLFFNGEPPHWYKAAYYRGILAESVAYKLEQALHEQSATCPEDFQNVDDVCCNLGSVVGATTNATTRDAWYGKMDIITTELIGAVQALAAMSFDPASVAKLLAAGGIGSGGPISLGMFIGTVLEIVSNKGFQKSHAKSAAVGEAATAASAIESAVQSAAERIAGVMGSAGNRHSSNALTLEGGAADIESQLQAMRESGEMRLEKMDRQLKQRAERIAVLEDANQKQRVRIGQLRREITRLEIDGAASSANMLLKIGMHSI